MKTENDKPEWLKIAEKELGTKEIPGDKDNPRIIEYHKATVLKGDHDEIPWCSAFVNWCMLKAGLSYTKSSVARSWLQWGETIREPRIGCVVVLKRGTKSWQGHVGFWVGKNQILGGNQSNSVSIMKFKDSDVIDYRWPTKKETRKK